MVGETTGDMHFKFENSKTGEKPIDWNLAYMFGSSPKTILEDTPVKPNFTEPEYTPDQLKSYIEQVLQLEAVACKDWLTNKVDRSVTGRVAKQQTTEKSTATEQCRGDGIGPAGQGNRYLHRSCPVAAG